MISAISRIVRPEECLIGQLNVKEDRLILRPFRRVPRRFFLREINPEKAPQEPHGEHCADHTERIRGGVADRDVFARITEFRKHIPRGAQPGVFVTAPKWIPSI